jgi:hypothetical protein
MSRTSSYAPDRRQNHDSRKPPPPPPPPLIDLDEPRHHQNNGQSHHDTYADEETYGLSGMISNWWGRTFSSRSNSYLSPESSIHSSTMPATGDGITRPYTPSRPSRSASPFMLPDYDPVELTGYHPDTGASEKLLNESVAEAIRVHFPERLRICEEWKLVYSLYQNGSSLATLYKLCEEYRQRRVGFVLVVRDGLGGTFGGYLTEAPHIAAGYYGSGECFLWKASVHSSLPPPPSDPSADLLTGDSTTIGSPTATRFPPQAHDGNGHAADQLEIAALQQNSVRFQVFPYAPPPEKKRPVGLSGLDDDTDAGANGSGSYANINGEWELEQDQFYFITSERGFLALGGGKGANARYGLWLDDAFNRGQSGHCGTFENEPLSDEGEKFDIIGVELWVIGSK